MLHPSLYHHNAPWCNSHTLFLTLTLIVLVKTNQACACLCDVSVCVCVQPDGAGVQPRDAAFGSSSGSSRRRRQRGAAVRKRQQTAARGGGSRGQRGWWQRSKALQGRKSVAGGLEREGVTHMDLTGVGAERGLTQEGA